MQDLFHIWNCGVFLAPKNQDIYCKKCNICSIFIWMTFKSFKFYINWVFTISVFIKLIPWSKYILVSKFKLRLYFLQCLYSRIANAPRGPSVKFLVENGLYIYQNLIGNITFCYTPALKKGVHCFPSVCPSVRPSHEYFFVAFFSGTTIQRFLKFGFRV